MVFKAMGPGEVVLSVRPMKTRGLKPQPCGNLVLRSSEEERIEQKRMRGGMLEVREQWDSTVSWQP